MNESAFPSLTPTMLCNAQRTIQGRRLQSLLSNTVLLFEDLVLSTSRDLFKNLNISFTDFYIPITMFKVLLSSVRLCAITSFSCNFVLQNYHSPFICYKEYFIHLYEFIQLCSRSEHIISSHLLKCLLNVIRKLVQVKLSCSEVFSFPTCFSSYHPSQYCSP